MDKKRCAAVDIRAQQAQPLVGCVPGLYNDVVQLIPQEIFNDAFIAPFDFKEICENTDRGQSSLQRAGLKKTADRLGRVSVLGNNSFERRLFAQCGGIFRAQAIESRFGSTFLVPFVFERLSCINQLGIQT